MKKTIFFTFLCLLFTLGSCKGETHTNTELSVVNHHNPIANEADGKQQRNFEQTISIMQDIGNISLQEMIKKYPNLKRSNNGGFASFRGKSVPMNTTYTLKPDFEHWVILQFDEDSSILQIVIDINVGKPFENLNNYFSSKFQIYQNLSLSEYEAVFKDIIKFKDYKQYLEEQKDNMAIFKHKDTMILLYRESADASRSSIFYRNSNYIPTLKAKYEKLYGPLPAHE